MNFLSRTTKPDEAATLVETIEARLGDARLAADAARAKYAEQVVDVELGDAEPDARPVKAARTALASAEDRVAELGLALDAARRRHEAAATAASAAERARRWTEVEKLAQEARRQAETVDQQITALLAARDELAGTLLRLHTAAPKRDAAIAHSRVSPSAVDDAMRMSLFKHGELWAWRSWLGDPKTAPSAAQRIEDATRTILDLRGNGQ